MTAPSSDELREAIAREEARVARLEDERRLAQGRLDALRSELAALGARGCLVLDLRMPGMSGLDLLRHLAATAMGSAPFPDLCRRSPNATQKQQRDDRPDDNLAAQQVAELLVDEVSTSVMAAPEPKPSG